VRVFREREGKMTKQQTTAPVSLRDIEDARKRIAPHLFKTPLSFSHGLSARFNRDVYIKWDNKLRTGSFKERGALNFLLRLSDEQRKQGVCAASAGNHALAVAWHCKKLGIPCTIVMPTTAPLVKIKTSSNFGAEVQLVGKILGESYEFAQELSRKQKKIFVPGYDHVDVVAGAGVSGLEILEDLPDFDSIVVPIGGGGLIAGIARALKESNHPAKIFGVRSTWTKGPGYTSPFSPSPIADGIAVKEIGGVPAEIIETDVDEILYVEEQIIASAVTLYLYEERTVIEGAGSASLATLMADMIPANFKKTVLLACGSNIDLNILARLIQRSQFQQGQLVRLRVSVPDRPGSLMQLTKCISDQHANVLETFHERSFSREPGNVEITFLLEIRDLKHKQSVFESLSALDLNPMEV